MDEIEKTRACKHPFCGCMSNKGYVCLHKGPCQPLDAEGRYFTVSYIEIEGQRLMCKTFTKSPTLTRIINAQTAQAAMGIQGAARKIQETIFADAEPFDPKKAVTDLVGS